MEIKFNVDIKTVKKAYALLGEDIPSDEEIENKMKDIVVDFTTMPMTVDVCPMYWGMSLANSQRTCKPAKSGGELAMEL